MAGIMRWQWVRAVLRELRKQPFVTGVFLASIVFVAARTALLSVPQAFPYGARIGDVIYQGVCKVHGRVRA
ncbi:MAG TPA: hypothetical protein VGI74_11920 [Streptosporangiaceae bacterium]